jgi:hypothetical protein
LGVAVKVHSGHGQARAVAAANIMSQLLPERFDLNHPWFIEQTKVRNLVKDIVGHVRVE